MDKRDIEELEARRAEVARQICRYMDPFVKQDKGDIRQLKRDEDILQSEIAKNASEFLKSAGYRADGSKRKKK